MIFNVKLLFAAAGLAGLATAITPPSDPDCYDGIICKDSITECGERYGGCYNPCHDPEPVAPPCNPSTITPEPTPEPTPTGNDDDCSQRIICIDAINSCGIPYGGCIPDCEPLDLTTPPCPTSTFATLTHKETGRMTIY